MDGQHDRGNHMLDLTFPVLKSPGRSLLATAMGVSACQIMQLECPDSQCVLFVWYSVAWG